jgi:hypothetical protein
MSESAIEMSKFDLWDKAILENKTIILKDIDSMQYSFQNNGYELSTTLSFVFDGIVVDCDIEINEDELMWVTVFPIIDGEMVTSHWIRLRDGIKPTYK